MSFEGVVPSEICGMCICGFDWAEACGHESWGCSSLGVANAQSQAVAADASSLRGLHALLQSQPWSVGPLVPGSLQSHPGWPRCVSDDLGAVTSNATLWPLVWCSAQLSGLGLVAARTLGLRQRRSGSTPTLGTPTCWAKMSSPCVIRVAWCRNLSRSFGEAFGVCDTSLLAACRDGGMSMTAPARHTCLWCRIWGD